jgi:hypothetical protein
MARAGRPKIEIKWDAVEALNAHGNTQADIAVYLGISVDTLDRACKRKYKKNFAEVFGPKRHAFQRISLRRELFERIKKSDTLLIFKCKQPEDKGGLGMSDRIDHNIKADVNTNERVFVAEWSKKP